MRLFFLLSSLWLLTACQNTESTDTTNSTKDSTTLAQPNKDAATVGGVQIEEAKLEQEVRSVPLPRSRVEVLQHYIALEDMVASESSELMLDLATKALNERYFYVDKNFEIQETSNPGMLSENKMSPYHTKVHQYIVAKMPDREPHMRQLTVAMQGQAGNEVFALRFTPGERNNEAPKGWNDWKGSFDFELSCPDNSSACNTQILNKTNKALNSLLQRTM